MFLEKGDQIIVWWFQDCRLNVHLGRVVEPGGPPKLRFYFLMGEDPDEQKDTFFLRFSIQQGGASYSDELCGIFLKIQNDVNYPGS